MNVYIGYVGEIFAGMVSWMSTLLTTVTSTPFLLLFLLIPVSMLGINLLRRMLRL